MLQNSFRCLALVYYTLKRFLNLIKDWYTFSVGKIGKVGAAPVVVLNSKFADDFTIEDSILWYMLDAHDHITTGPN